MSVFGRRRSRRSGASDEGLAAGGAELSEAAADVDERSEPEAGEPDGGVDSSSEHGPWDVEVVPDDDGIERIDLGALRIPTLQGTELRLEADESGQVNTVLLVSGDSALQLGVFAAPRTEGIWAEVRAEIGAGIQADGGQATEAIGRRGDELHTRLKNGDTFEPVRFVGIDGPRWLVRAVFTGRAGESEDAEGVLAEALEQVVVVRGDQALPVRDPLPLALPREVVAAAVEAEPDA